MANNGTEGRGRLIKVRIGRGPVRTMSEDAVLRVEIDALKEEIESLTRARRSWQTVGGSGNPRVAKLTRRIFTRVEAVEKKQRRLALITGDAYRVEA